MSQSIIAAWTSLFIAIMLFLVLRHPTCEPCVAWMCCGMSNSIKHAWACPDLSLQRWHRFLIAIMLLLVLRHPTCASCVAWMCCRMSNSIKHVWAFPDQTLYTFLHSFRSNFSPSRPLQLWFEADCETSLARDIHAMQSTPKSRRGRYCFICASIVRNSEYRGSGRQNMARAIPESNLITC